MAEAARRSFSFIVLEIRLNLGISKIVEPKLSNKEWDFSSVHADDAKACLMWELARESLYMHDLPNHWEELGAMDPQIPPAHLFPFLNRGHIDLVKRPWLDLSNSERKDVCSKLLPVDLVAIPGVEVAQKMLFPDKSENQVGEERRDYLYIVIEPKSWRTYTDNEISGALRRIVERRRPNSIPEPAAKRGKRNNALIAALRWVAAMRLRHHYSMSEVFDVARPDEQGSFFYDEADCRWGEEAPWLSAREHAKKKMHELFPFLPDDEEPLSYSYFVDRI